MARAWLFPGQGSQRRGMGAGLFDEHADLVTAANEQLGYSVREICERGGRELADTEYVQPLLFLVNALHLREISASGGLPDFLAGHSLGEISALYAAGCLDFEAGLRIVRRRAELMAGCPPGAMLAVLGLELPALTELLTEHRLDQIDVANHNSPGQIVVAGPAEPVGRLAELIERLDTGKVARLKVSIAAHSRYMQPAVAEYAALLGKIRFSDPTVPVVSSVTGKPYRPGEVADVLVRQLTSRVVWWDVLCELSRSGVQEVREVGPGDVLGKLWQRVRGELPGARAVPDDLPPDDLPPDERREPNGTARRSSRARDTHHWISALGDPRLCQAYRLDLPYLADALPDGGSGPELLRRLAGSGLFGFLSSSGQSLDQLADDIAELTDIAGNWGIELPAARLDPGRARRIADAAAAAGVGHAVTAGWAGPSAELVRWRFAREPALAARRLLVRVRGQDHVAPFLRPAPADLIAELRSAGELTERQAAEAAREPVATEICVFAGNDGDGPAELMLPAVRVERDAARHRHGYAEPVPVGVGGVGAPEHIAAALLIGADFVMASAVNQCTRQARVAEPVKDLLDGVGLNDTVLVPSAKLYRLGGQVHAVRRSTLFPSRASALYELYRGHAGLDAIPPRLRNVLERECFDGPLEDVVVAAGADPAGGLAAVLDGYLDFGTRAARAADPASRLHWQVRSEPELAVFNAVAGELGLADRRSRDAEVVAERLTEAAAELLDRRLHELLGCTSKLPATGERSRLPWAAHS